MEQTSNRIPLDEALVEEFKGYQRHIRDNTVAMAEKAYGVRSQYLSADGRKYDPEFEDWWLVHNLKKVFGSRANFTKWASAGAALAKATFHKHSDRMPTTLTALYEVAQLTPDEVKLCLENRYTRKSLTDEPTGLKTPSPVIHPEATAAAIKSWREHWRKPPVQSTEKRRLPFATIHAHASIYDFEKATGKHGGMLTPDKLKEIDDRLIEAMKPFDEFVLLQTKLTELLGGHQKRQAQAELRLENARQRTAKKAAKKKPKKQS
jgi:hypothetical protein